MDDFVKIVVFRTVNEVVLANECKGPKDEILDSGDNLAVAGFWFANNANFSFTQDAPQKHTLLMQVGDKCEGISENAASKLVAIVEFQKLEIEGRKSRVMLNCMNDQGYVENPAWASYATPIAKNTASKTGVSFNEAIENMRRTSMLVFETRKDAPIFWVQTKAAIRK